MRILYCKQCKKFTMKETCECGKETFALKPAKYSPEDKWARYRRIAKKQQQDL